MIKIIRRLLNWLHREKQPRGKPPYYVFHRYGDKIYYCKSEDGKNWTRWYELKQQE